MSNKANSNLYWLHAAYEALKKQQAEEAAKQAARDALVREHDLKIAVEDARLMGIALRMLGVPDELADRAIRPDGSALFNNYQLSFEHQNTSIMDSEKRYLSVRASLLSPKDATVELVLNIDISAGRLSILIGEEWEDGILRQLRFTINSSPDRDQYTIDEALAARFAQKIDEMEETIDYMRKTVAEHRERKAHERLYPDIRPNRSSAEVERDRLVEAVRTLMRAVQQRDEKELYEEELYE